jgi:aryl-alcohol dehydrogenase-like predicted oxidoreductase
MKYVPLGRTGLLVSKMCLGGANFGGAKAPPYDVLGGLTPDVVGDLVRVALDAGVNFIDTSNTYAFGESEELLGKLLKGHRRDVVLASKVQNRVGVGPNDVGQSRVHIVNALEDSLRRLDTDYLDLYQVHSFDPLTPFDESLRALDDLVRQGKVRYIGCSNLAAWQVMKALGVSAERQLAAFVSVQAYYSLVGRDVEHELVPLVEDQGLALTVWSPLAGGLLSGKFTRDGASDPGARRTQLDFPPVDMARAHDVIDVLIGIASDHDVSAAQVALAWLLARPAVTSIVVGARRASQLADNLAAVDLELDDVELRALDAVSAPTRAYPGWLQDYTNAERWPTP